jgi:hypothetical protein
MAKEVSEKTAAKLAERVAKYRKKYDIPESSLVAVGTGGYIAFDGAFITLRRVGIGVMSTGKGVKRIPLRSVTAVQVKPAGAVMNGFLQLTIPGGNEVRSKFGSQTTSAVNDENSVIFNIWEQPAFLVFRDAIEQAMVAQHAAPPPSVIAPDVMGQLAQLGQLRDAGVVTAEEFEIKKAELLGRL